MRFDDLSLFERNSSRSKSKKFGCQTTKKGINAEFQCLHCHSWVTPDFEISGVKNRNHCPYCLWSKHLDLWQAGDRLSACKAGMQPIGLSLKFNHKKYHESPSGELMLIHQCVDCGKISINRIAADDFSDLAFQVFETSFNLDEQKRLWLSQNMITVLDQNDHPIVRARLFGWNSAG